MVQKKEGLESLIKKEFQKLSFYNSEYDTLEISKTGERYFVEYTAVKPEEKFSYNNQYFNCSIEISLEDKSATWNYIHLDEEYRKKGWGGELISTGESMFKKLGVQTAYVHNNINPGFWTRMGYPISLKILKKKTKNKNFYFHAHELISSIAEGEEGNVLITEYDRVLELSYDSRKKGSYLDETSIELKVDMPNKTAAWTRLSAPAGKKSRIMGRCEEMLKNLGIKTVHVDTYNPEPIWKRKGYTSCEDGDLCKAL